MTKRSIKGYRYAERANNITYYRAEHIYFLSIYKIAIG